MTAPNARLTLVLAALLTATLTRSAAAQNGSGINTDSPGPPGAPAPNINTGGNPSAPPPPSSIGISPTYPAGSNMPAWRGGTIGADPALDKGALDRAGTRKAKLSRERSLPEPGVNANPSTAPGTEETPESGFAPPDPSVNPGALEGGSRP
jgi:hypothetical protein